MSERHTYLPAAPGFNRLYLVTDKNGKPQSVEKDPIVGWAVSEFGGIPYPVVLDSSLETEFVPVERPDGIVSHNGDQFPSVQAWLEHAIRTHGHC